MERSVCHRNPNMKITTPGMRATDEQPFQGSGCWTCLTQGSSSLATLVYFDDAFGIGIESKQLLQLLQRSKRRASRSIRYAEGIATLGLPITAWNPEGVPEGFAFFGLRAACCRFRGASLLASKFDRRTGSPTTPIRPQKLSSRLLRRKAAAGCSSPRCFAPKCPNHSLRAEALSFALAGLQPETDGACMADVLLHFLTSRHSGRSLCSVTQLRHERGSTVSRRRNCR